MNLLNNGFKYTRAGGRITLRAYESNGRVRIEVEDECGGVPNRKAIRFSLSAIAAARTGRASGWGCPLPARRSGRRAEMSAFGTARTRLHLHDRRAIAFSRGGDHATRIRISGYPWSDQLSQEQPRHLRFGAKRFPPLGGSLGERLPQRFDVRGDLAGLLQLDLNPGDLTLTVADGASDTVQIPCPEPPASLASQSHLAACRVPS